VNNLTQQQKSRASDRTLICLALTTLLIHILSDDQYGYFRDELYSIACSKHLAWGYVDQPPFSELILFISGHLIGYSLFALRFLPAVCAALVAFLVGLIARQMGGGRWAQMLAVTAFIVGGVYLAIDNYYSMNCFDHLFWALAILILVRILKDGDSRLWLLFGLVAGVGLENKYSMGFLGLGLIAGLALTPARRHFRDKWLWLGGAMATLIFLPHVLWEALNHFPTAEFIHNVTTIKNLPMTPWAFLRESALEVNPCTLPVWLGGLIYLFISREGRRFQVLGWIYLVVLGILLSTHSKPYYFAPAFLIVLPAGGVAIEGFIAQRGWNWLKPAYLSVLGLTGIALAPLVLPVLPVKTFIQYQSRVGIRPSVGERGAQSTQLPQMYADMFGWPEMAAQMAEIYDHLAPEEKVDCVIGASNYGEAGAIDFFGKPYGLPNAISSHNNYWFWGPGDKPGKVLLVIGGSKEGYERMYEDVKEVATFQHPYSRESGTRIYLCRKPRHTLQEIWPHIRTFI
jgi:hypothetical protein